MVASSQGLDSARIAITIQQADFDFGQCYQAMAASDTSIGAVVGFVGRVRDLNLAADVAALELEHYPGMTEKVLRDLAQQAAKRWSLLAVSIVHRVGKLYPGDQIVLVLTASAHRHAGYEANAFLMDQLKTSAPFWKKEWTAAGPRWVDARASDASASERWHQLMQDQYGYGDHD